MIWGDYRFAPQQFAAVLSRLEDKCRFRNSPAISALPLIAAFGRTLRIWRSVPRPAVSGYRLILVLAAAVRLASVPIPKYAIHCSTRLCELRNQRDTANLMILVWFLDLKFLY